MAKNAAKLYQKKQKIGWEPCRILITKLQYLSRIKIENEILSDYLHQYCVDFY